MKPKLGEVWVNRRFGFCVRVAAVDKEGYGLTFIRLDIEKAGHTQRMQVRNFTRNYRPLEA